MRNVSMLSAMSSGGISPVVGNECLGEAREGAPFGLGEEPPRRRQWQEAENQ